MNKWIAFDTTFYIWSFLVWSFWLDVGGSDGLGKIIFDVGVYLLIPIIHADLHLMHNKKSFMLEVYVFGKEVISWFPKRKWKKNT